MKHVVILGCGQLARLMALAGKPLGLRFTFVSINGESTQCVDSLGNIVHWDSFITVSALVQSLGQVDVVTVERESIDSTLLQELSLSLEVHPRADAVIKTKNRLAEKEELEKHSIACTPWVYITEPVHAQQAVDQFGFPLVFKSLENGYDGKNQWMVKSQDDINQLFEDCDGFGWIAEPKIDFEKEVSMICVRSSHGDITFYPITENEHKNGILRASIAPANGINEDWQKSAREQLSHLLNAWQYTGVLVAEFFVTNDGLLVNELAPRVHNSGHWTEHGATTSQFENHLRAILGMELGGTTINNVAGMINILGSEQPTPVPSIPGANIQLYNKDNRPGRKLGHINIVGKAREEVLSQMNRLRAQ